MHQPAFGVLLEAWFVVTCEQHVRNHRMIFCTFFLFVGTSTAHTIHIVAPLRCRAGCIWGYCCPYISVTMCDKRLSRLEGNSCPSSISFSMSWKTNCQHRTIHGVWRARWSRGFQRRYHGGAVLFHQGVNYLATNRVCRVPTG